MYKLVISIVSTSLLLGGCGTLNSHRQQTATIPPAGTGALIDGTTADNANGIENESSMGSGVASQIGDTVESERRYEYRSGR